MVSSASPRYPVEAKAKAAPVGSAAGAGTGLVIFVLGRWVFGGTVPDDVQTMLLIILPAVFGAAGSFAAAYAARHTHRRAAPLVLAPSSATTAAGAIVYDRPADAGGQ